MPQLERETDINSLDEIRFVRVGDNIFIPVDYRVSHESLAHQNGVRETGVRNKLVVDDAGFLYLMGGELVAGSKASSVIVRGNEDEQREYTNSLIRNILRS